MNEERIVHQTYISKKLPWIYQKILNSNKEKNPDWEFILWDDDELADWINKVDPLLHQLFLKCPLGIQRGDLARLLLIYYKGGVYIDLDIELIKPLDNIFKRWGRAAFLITSEPRQQIIYLYHLNFFACNAFMYSPAGNPLLGRIINDIRTIYDMYGDIILRQFNIFGGPLLTKHIHAWKPPHSLINIPDETEFYPINDIKLKNLPTYSRDLQMIKTGPYPSSAYMIHYWIHGDFESKQRLNSFRGNEQKSIHENVYDLLQPIYNLPDIRT